MPKWKKVAIMRGFFHKKYGTTQYVVFCALFFMAIIKCRHIPIVMGTCFALLSLFVLLIIVNWIIIFRTTKESFRKREYAKGLKSAMSFEIKELL